MTQSCFTSLFLVVSVGALALFVDLGLTHILIQPNHADVALVVAPHSEEVAGIVLFGDLANLRGAVKHKTVLVIGEDFADCVGGEGELVAVLEVFGLLLIFAALDTSPNNDVVSVERSSCRIESLCQLGGGRNK